VIDAFRASPWVEHKLRLDEILGGTDNALRRAAAAAAELSERDFLRAVDLLPPMDIYVADRDQRRSWTAVRGDVVVVGSLAHSSFTHFTPVESRAVQSVIFAEADAIIVIHPAELRSYRIGRMANPGPGEVIDDGSDADGGLVVEYTDRTGRTVVLDVGETPGVTRAQIMTLLRITGLIGVDHSRAAGSNTVLAQTASTGTVWFANVYTEDGVGSAEIEWKTTKRNGSTNCCEVKYRWTGVDQFDILIADPTWATCHDPWEEPGYHPGCLPGVVMYSGWVPGFDQYDRVHGEPVETDTGTDDHYGQRQWFSGDSGVFYNYFGWPQGGNTDCGTFQGGGLRPCMEAVVAYFF
jgi:hypothetical protein